jgi:hypothetical protein
MIVPAYELLTNAGDQNPFHELLEDNRIQEFNYYFVNTWLYSPLFALNFVHIGLERFRTNNHVEAWHRKLHSEVGKNWNIWEFIAYLVQEELLSYHAIVQINAGHVYTKQKQKYTDINNRIQAAQQELNNNMITVIEFLSRMTHLHS